MHKMTAIELKHALQTRKIGAEELTRFYIQRIESLDKSRGLNSVAELNPSAIEQARALDQSRACTDLPLFGLPILVKDNIDVVGLHTTAGSLALSDNIAQTDAPVIENLRRNGAIILGKTNMTEFANYTTQGMPNGYSSRGGQVRSAYAPSLDPGGSSSGSAVAMSAGFCAAAIGTDTSFSIVACAAANGVVGLKPACGSLSNQGIIPISHTLDSAGPLSRTFSDALLVYSGMRGQPLPAVQPTSPEKLRIAVNTFNLDMVSEAQLSYYDALFSDLHKAGAAISEANHPYAPGQRDIMRCEFRHDLEAYLSASTAGVRTLDEIVRLYESDPVRMMKYGITCLQEALDNASGMLDDEPYLAALAERKILRAQLLEDLQKYDVCAMTGPTNIMHFLGLPSLALKLCMGRDRAPKGIILYGADEARLFSAALTIERYCREVLSPEL